MRYMDYRPRFDSEIRVTRARAERLHVVDVDLRAAARSRDARRGLGGTGQSTAVR